MKTLAELRTEIDAIDSQLLALLGKRLQIAREIGRIKKREHLPILDEQREKTIKSKLAKEAKSHGLSAPVIEEVYQLLLEYMRMEMEGVK